MRGIRVENFADDGILDTRSSGNSPGVRAQSQPARNRRRNENERNESYTKTHLELITRIGAIGGHNADSGAGRGTGDEPVVTPYVKTFAGLTFEFTLDVPERPFFRYGAKHVDVHYTITKSNDNNMGF